MHPLRPLRQQRSAPIGMVQQYASAEIRLAAKSPLDNCGGEQAQNERTRPYTRAGPPPLGWWPSGPSVPQFRVERSAVAEFGGTSSKETPPWAHGPASTGTIPAAVSADPVRSLGTAPGSR